MDIADQDINVIMKRVRHTLGTLQDMDDVARAEQIQSILEITRSTLETLRDNETSANTFHAIESRINCIRTLEMAKFTKRKQNEKSQEERSLALPDSSTAAFCTVFQPAGFTDNGGHLVCRR